MRVLVAPDKFKGCLPASAVADSIAAGLDDAGALATTLPLADGGDGSVAAAIAAGFTPHAVFVNDALGQPRSSCIAVRDRTAVIEIANTCGLATLDPAARAPLRASSYGFGQAISYAVQAGMNTIVLALGGSASTDGGTGMLAALGYHFVDTDGRRVPAFASDLLRISAIQHHAAIDLSSVTLIVATDVTNPLTGPDGAAATFGPQKGATPTDVDHLEAGLHRLVDAAHASGWQQARDLAQAAGSGAAGGCGFATLLLGATITSGADYFLDLHDFEHALTQCDVVITGEGRLDSQTLFGKLPAIVAQRATPRPVVAVVGRNDLRGQRSPFHSVHAVADHSDQETAHDPVRSAEILRAIGADIARSLQQSCDP